MCKRLTYLAALVLVLGLVGSARADLVAHWALDEGAGTVAADSSGNGNDGTLDADPIWVVKLSRQFSENVSGNLVYGRREVDNIMSPQTIPITNIDDVDMYAENDPIQVIRAEVCVAF